MQVEDLRVGGAPLPLASTAAIQLRDARPEGRGWADALLELGEVPFLWVERVLARALPSWLNPAAHTGALANANLIVAVASGVLLLFWYSPSVHLAYASVQAMDQAPWSSGLVRSVHRYSSDLAMLFALWHGARLFFARRVLGPRSRAWLTGLLAVLTLGFVGWTGYWLVWDQRAQLVAQHTARLLDPLPIFTEPLSRSFLADESVNSLLFFVVFFIHMLVPMVGVFLLWLHVTRLARPRFLPPRALWIGLGLLLLGLAGAFNATAAGPARLLFNPAELSLDAWYLLPLYALSSAGVGVLWGVSLGLTALLFVVPRLLAWGRRPQVAVVHDAACNGCTLCFEDCPYEAISMVPREDGSRFDLVARVDPDACTGCGICAGACVPGGITVPQLPVIETRKRLDRWVADAVAQGEQPTVTFVCGSGAGADLSVDPRTGRCEALPGHRVLAVPCAAAVQTLTLERVLKRGAKQVVLVGCGPVECTYREGGMWLQGRLEAQREPKLRHQQVARERVTFVQADRLQSLRKVMDSATAAQAAGVEARRGRGGQLLAGVTGLVVVGVLGALTLGWGATPFVSPPTPPELVFSFRHPGERSTGCRKATEEELAALPPHMRRPEICERGRAPIRVRLSVDGQVVAQETHAGRGLNGDGNSVAIIRQPLPPGSHQVRVELGETHDPGEWRFHSERSVSFAANQAVVVLFDRTAGFTWHEGSTPPPPAAPGAAAPLERSL